MMVLFYTVSVLIERANGTILQCQWDGIHLISLTTCELDILSRLVQDLSKVCAQHYTSHRIAILIPTLISR